MRVYSKRMRKYIRQILTKRKLVCLLIYRGNKTEKKTLLEKKYYILRIGSTFKDLKKKTRMFLIYCKIYKAKMTKLL